MIATWPDTRAREVLQHGVGRLVIADPTHQLDVTTLRAASMAMAAAGPSATIRPPSRRPTGEPTTTITR